MASDHVPRPPTLNGLNHQGRPTKRTKKVVSELLDAISSGAPYGLACQAGIHHDTFNDWRRRDPAFALQVDQAAARGTIKRLKKIEAQGTDGAWAALAWLVERRYPADFAKPEVALNVGIQNNLSAAKTSECGFEAVVVSDLEFLKLREHENYSHRGADRPARDVEGETVVEPELSGALVRADHPGGMVVSESQAAEDKRRSEKVSWKIEGLFSKWRAKTRSENGSMPTSEPKSGT